MTHHLAAVVEQVLTHNTAAIADAARVIVTTGRSGGLLYSAGAGHSLAAVLETFYRAGGLAFVRPLWDMSILPLAGGRASTTAERVPGRGRAVATRAGITEADAVIIFSNSGINPYPLEIAESARDVGATVIAVTSTAASAAAPLRAGTRLADVAAIVLDTLVPPGDVSWPPDEPVTVPLSTLATTVLWAEILWCVHDVWPDAPRWRSGNMAGTDDANETVAASYAGRIPEL